MDKQESSFRWVVISVVLLAYFLIVSQRTAPGLITDQLMEDFHVSAAMIGLTSSIQFFAYAGLQIPSGLLSDRFGPDRFLINGTLLAGLGSMIYSIAPNEYVLLFSRLLVGVGDAAILINLVLILTQWFVANEFVKMLGVTTVLGSLGSLFATVPFSMFITYAGWRSPFLGTGIVLVGLSILLYIVLILQPKKLFKDDSQERANSKKNRESVRNILRRIVTTRRAWGPFLCHFGVAGTYIGFIGSWGVPYGIQVFELSRLEASQLIMYGLIGAVIGPPIINGIVGRLGSIKKVYMAVQLLVFLSWTGLFLSGLTPSFALVVILFFMIGIGMGANSLTFAAVRKLFPIGEVGVATGFANTGGFLSAVLLPIIFGNVLDLFPQESIKIGYHYGFMIPVLFSFMGIVGVLLIKKV